MTGATAVGFAIKSMEGIPMSARLPVPVGLHTSAARLPVEGDLRSFSGAAGWLNSPPLTPAALRGQRPGQFLDLHVY
jgi:hypothetical protein